ncbi:Phage protein [Vibrio crassostreae]|nr:Phage_TAC_2 domain-containing protein [Vibrio phage 187P1]CAK2034302.1 Phage protein [Vibrio crassostreae]CAK2912876.1 Phage protein [Vibrio crassostreae]CAK2918567.1 Phage protein [Vibrio crassostreae]CAK2932653.1 Phage protein [Vibrio crassostreae]
MKTFLKTKEVPFDGENIAITQLSGLERFDFLDYCSDLPKPETPVRPAEEASEQEHQQFYESMSSVAKKWERLSFMGQSRLVAYGCQFDIDDLEERHQFIMSSMIPDQVKTLHDEIAKFSGIPLPEPDEDTENSDKPEQELEPADPKG